MLFLLNISDHLPNPHLNEWQGVAICVAILLLLRLGVAVAEWRHANKTKGRP